MARRATSHGPKPSLFFRFCFLFFGLFVFFCFSLGSGEVARKATSLGPKPSLFCLFVCFVFFVFFCCFFFPFFASE